MSQNLWGLSDLVPHLDRLAKENSVPIFATRELRVAAIVGGKLNPFRAEITTFSGPSWPIYQENIDGALDHLRKTEESRRALHLDLQTRVRQGGTPITICPINVYSKMAEMRVEEFYLAFIEAGFELFDVVQASSSNIQVQVIESDKIKEFANDCYKMVIANRMAGVPS
jgi:hypothetical protein